MEVKNFNKKLITLSLLVILTHLSCFINSYTINNDFLHINFNSEFFLEQFNSPLAGINIGWITTHGENSNSTYLITLNDAINMGANSLTITTEINNTLLSNFQIVIIEQGGASWTPVELNSLAIWVNNGGSVYILGDDLDPPQKNVSSKFNIFYNETDPISGDITNLNYQYPILNGVNNLYAFWPGASINITNSTNSLMNIALTDDLAVIVTALQVNQGRILINIDSDGMIRDDWINDAGSDNHIFANNSWLWLANVIGNGDSPSSDSVPYYILLFNSLNSISIPWIMLLAVIISGLVILIILIFQKFKSKTK